MDTVTVYVSLLDEGAPTIRPTQAISLGKGIYKLLPTPDYDPMDEIWEYLPGSLVKCKIAETDKGEKVLLASAKVD